MWTFDPTAHLTDFDRVSGLRADWDNFISGLYETHLYGRPGDRVTSALEELQSWGRSDSDLRVYNPSSMPVPEDSDSKNVHWSALPTSFDEQFNSEEEKYHFLDNRQSFPGAPSLVTRIQDEYCEWVVSRNTEGKITRVLFTSEPPEYYQFLFLHSDEARELLVELYKEITGIDTITLASLTDVNGDYDWWNKYNNDFAVHMQQPNNTLGAQVNIVSRSCILRINQLGGAITDALGLIRCAGYGDPNRQSDPRIGHAVNTFSAENRFLTVENPVGLYMSGVDWSGWTTPDNTSPQTFFQVLRGSENADPNKSFIVRAEYAVPTEKGYTVSDIKINGEPIKFGGQIANRIDVRVGVLVSDVLTIPPPQPIHCTGVPPTLLPGPSLLASGVLPTRTVMTPLIDRSTRNDRRS